MAQPIRQVCVEHTPVVHAIETTPSAEPLPLTLLELVAAVDEVSDSEEELLGTVVHMLRSGRVRLSGSFRDLPVDEFLD